MRSRFQEVRPLPFTGGLRWSSLPPPKSAGRPGSLAIVWLLESNDTFATEWTRIGRGFRKRARDASESAENHRFKPVMSSHFLLQRVQGATASVRL